MWSVLPLWVEWRSYERMFREETAESLSRWSPKSSMSWV